MKATQFLHEFGQSIWLDNITRDLLNTGRLNEYITDFSITGLTSNPTIFDHAIRSGLAYDESIARQLARTTCAEDIFFNIAVEDLGRAADLFRPVFDKTNGVDGWVSLELSPMLTRNTTATLRAAKELHSRAARRNLFIKIPGTEEGLVAIEEAIFAGVPVNVTLLFSPEQYLAAAEAYMRGIERRIHAGLNPHVGSVASVFISRWDAAVNEQVPVDLKNRLGIAVAQQTYRAYRELLGSHRWQRAFSGGARSQRLLWASTGTKDPNASDILYVKELAAPNTINTMPEATLKALADHGELRSVMPPDGGDCDAVISQFARLGVQVTGLAARLQQEGAESFVKSWSDLLMVIHSKANSLKTSNSPMVVS